MEDRHSIIHVSLKATKNVTSVAVFDGHGGPECAEYANTKLPPLVSSSVVRALNSGKSNEETRAKLVEEHFMSVDKTFRQQYSSSKAGTTALFANLWWNVERNTVMVQIANLGDCRAIACRVVNGEDTVLPLSIDQTADNECERHRVIKQGGRISQSADGRNRVQGHIQVTRSLGDAVVKPYGVISCPEVREHELDPSKDEFLVCATDGVYDSLTNKEVLQTVRDTAKDPGLAAKRIVGQALAKGSKDNITCVVVFLREFDAVDRIF